MYEIAYMLKVFKSNIKMNKKPTIVIVGRPNVGKSTLFNRLAGRRMALVHDKPGVTRDQRSLDVTFYGGDYTIMDTPGLYDPQVDDVPDAVKNGMREQAFKALQQADLICFMIDGRQGCTPYDFALANDIRSFAKKVVILVNKAEGTHGIQGIADAATLGLGDDIIPISAEHGEGMSDLAEVFGKNLKNNSFDADDELEEEAYSEKAISLTIMGRPNAGKSTLFNTLIGKEQQLTGDFPGLTRDAIEHYFDYQGKTFKLIDTAGIRRQSKVNDVVEKLAVVDAEKALRYTEIVILLIDASISYEKHFEKQDLHLAQKVLEEGRILILAFNKWDQVKDKKQFLEHIHNELSYKLCQAQGIPVVTLSALDGTNSTALLDHCLKLYKSWNERIPTGRLNDWFNFTVKNHQPPISKGQRIRLKYITQIKSRPPSFVVFGTKNTEVPESYKRYLINKLREDFSLKGIPIRLHFKSPKNPYAQK